MTHRLEWEELIKFHIWIMYTCWRYRIRWVTYWCLTKNQIRSSILCWRKLKAVYGFRIFSLEISKTEISSNFHSKELQLDVYLILLQIPISNKIQKTFCPKLFALIFIKLCHWMTQSNILRLSFVWFTFFTDSVALPKLFSLDFKLRSV